MILFRRPLKEFAYSASTGRPLRRIKAGSVEVEWEELDKAENNTSTPSQVQDNKTPNSVESGTDARTELASNGSLSRFHESPIWHLAKIIETNPNTAIELTYDYTKDALQELGRRRGALNDSTPFGLRVNLEWLLVSEGVISEQTGEQFRRLQKIRNQLGEANDTRGATPVRAAQYWHIANDLLAGLPQDAT